MLACGQLSRPRWPSIPGMDEFEGRSFHSAEWDHGYDLAGKRVAVIGTGASAIQFVPPVAERAARVDVYQRSAPYVLPRDNPEYRPSFRRLIQRVPGLQAARRYGMWAFMEMFVAGLTRVPPLGWLLRAWSTAFMRSQLTDPEVRRKAWPDYPFGCKRILFSSDYLPALQRPDVELVTDAIARLTPRGVATADGREREVDCIVYGTGFRSSDFVMPMQVSGGRRARPRRGLGRRAPRRTSASRSPASRTCSCSTGPNTNLGVGSIIVMIEAQVRLRDRRASGTRGAPAPRSTSGPRCRPPRPAACRSGCATRSGRAAATGTARRAPAGS